MSKNCLSYWFPKIEQAGLPVPRTFIEKLPDELVRELYAPFDGRRMGDGVKPFFDALRQSASVVGYPCFLRTGMGSGKHCWKDTCFVTKPEDIEQHVVSLVEWSECVDFMGLPFDVWAVREFLPTAPVMVADRYGKMPVCREFRLFVDGGKIRCWHPYWPADAIHQGMASLPSDFAAQYEQLCRLRAHESDHLFHLAERAGAAVGGSWSVDILDTARGWFVTDMAEAAHSFHWEGCPHA